MIEVLSKLSSEELLYFFPVVFMVVRPLYYGLISEDKAKIWSPLTMVSFVYLYYVVVGPLVALYLDDTIYRNVDHRAYYLPTYKGALLSLFFTQVGFYTTQNKYNSYKPDNPLNFSDEDILKNSKNIYKICFVCMLIISGPGIINRFNFLSNAGTNLGYTGAFKLYFWLAMNAFTLSAILLIKPFLDGKYKKYFYAFFILTACLYINEAFRYRLVILLFSSLITYHLLSKKKMNIKLVVSLVVPFLLLMGIIELGRTYGRGIDLDRLEGKEDKNILESSFAESNVFMSTGYLLAHVDEVTEKTGFAMFTNAIAFPIPRKLWSGKPDGSYLLGTITLLYGEVGEGLAFLHYAEYYLSFGWWGVVVLSFCYGMFLKWGWTIYLRDRNNFYAICFFAIFSSFSYTIISRAYLPLQFVNYMFFVYPAYYLYKKKTKSELNPSHRHRRQG